MELGLLGGLRHGGQYRTPLVAFEVLQAEEFSF